MKQAAPLFTRTYDLFVWLMGRLEHQDAHPFLSQATLETIRKLLESTTLALKGFAPLAHALEADAALALLRLYVALLGDHDILNEDQHAHAVREMDQIGRQLGGWLKSMEDV